MKTQHITGILAAAMLLTACGGGGSAGVPKVNQANLGSNALQVAVGTANIAGTPGLNVVATYRQPNGLSGAAANTPSITGPSGFTVPAGAMGAYGAGNVDAGTNKITGSPQVNLATTPVNSTLGTFTGVFSYGLAPLNSDQTGTAYLIGSPNATAGNGFTSSAYFDTSQIAAALASADGVTLSQLVSFGLFTEPTQPQPFFSANPMDYVIGPPAVPFFMDGTFPAGLAGYSPGFTVFQMTPVPGTYTVTLNISATNAPSTTATGTATLSSPPTSLGATSVTFTKDGAGGGSGTVTVPAGVTETLVYVADLHISNSGAGTVRFYTVGPLTGTGAVPYTLPDNLGPCIGANCQNSSATATPTLTTGDMYFVSAVGYDYPAFEAGPPGNTQQKPAIANSAGQADLTMSTVVSGTY